MKRRDDIGSQVVRILELGYRRNIEEHLSETLKPLDSLDHLSHFGGIAVDGRILQVVLLPTPGPPLVVLDKKRVDLAAQADRCLYLYPGHALFPVPAFFDRGHPAVTMTHNDY